MDGSDVEFLKTPKSESAPISSRADLEGDHLDKDRRGQRGEEDRQGGKKRQLVREDNSFELSVCYQ